MKDLIQNYFPETDGYEIKDENMHSFFQEFILS